MRYSLLAEEIADFFYSDEGSEGSRGSVEYWGNVEAIEDIIEDFMQNKLTLGE
tara:strand:+ start:530 stop:688 length:159 start_codon:yes stop_codon:yes gene_type:complete